MTAKSFCFFACIAMLFCGDCLGAEAARASSARASGRGPNILFLLADDMRWDTLGCAGNKVIQTPNIDRLSARGVMFNNYFVTTPICCVSRASMFSGQWESRHHIPDFATRFTPAAWAQTYPMLMHAAGYRTGFIGKFGVGAKVDGPARTFDYWRGFAGQGHYFTKGDLEHLTAKMGDQAIEFLRESDKDRPFCLSVSFKAPHAQDGAPREFPPDPRDELLYDDVTMPVPITGTPAYFDLMPPFVQHSESRRRWERRFATPEMFQKTVRDYYRLIFGIDREVGRIVKTLADLHLTDDTIILFASDNGMFLGEHGLADKWLLYEESIRDPLIVVDPRGSASRQGVKEDPLTLNVDLAPTMLDYAGVDVPPRMQGHSLRPLVEGQSIPWRSEAYFEHHTLPRLIAPSEGIRTKSWKYIRWIAPNPMSEEIYDLAADPHEEHNLAHDPKYADTLNTLRKQYERLKDEAK